MIEYANAPEGIAWSDACRQAVGHWLIDTFTLQCSTPKWLIPIYLGMVVLVSVVVFVTLSRRSRTSKGWVIASTFSIAIVLIGIFLIHATKKNIADYMVKVNLWTKYEAHEIVEKNKHDIFTLLY